MGETWDGEEHEGDTTSKGGIWGKNKPSAIPCEPQPHPTLFLPPMCFRPSPMEHPSRITALGALSTAEEGQGSLELADCHPFLSLTHCVTLGKSHDVSAPQTSLGNARSLYCVVKVLNIEAVSDLLPKGSFLMAVVGDGDAGGKLRQGREEGQDRTMPTSHVHSLSSSL